MVPRSFLLISLARVPAVVLAFTACLLAACSDEPAQSAPCMVMSRTFCISTAVSDYDVTVEEKAKNIDRSIYLVKGRQKQQSGRQFVAVIRDIHDPDITSSQDRVRLCQTLGLDVQNCVHSPLKTVLRKYEVLYEGDRESITHGIKIDLISAVGVSPDIADSLAYPCTWSPNKVRICGPHMGTCIQSHYSDGCDFRNGWWTMWLKWKWRVLGHWGI